MEVKARTGISDSAGAVFSVGESCSLCMEFLTLQTLYMHKKCYIIQPKTQKT